MSRSTMSGVTGIIGALVGGYLGYRQAIEAGMEQPWQGAVILGAVGLVLGSAGGFLLRSLSSILVYAVLLGVLSFVFRGQIEMLTGIDPVAAGMTIFNDILVFVQGKVAEQNGG